MEGVDVDSESRIITLQSLRLIIDVCLMGENFD